MLSSERTQVPFVPGGSVLIVEDFLFGPDTRAGEPGIEETLTKENPAFAGDAPGNFKGVPAQCCRTVICTCTRAVPHGSFL